MALFLFLLFPSQQAGSSQPAGREAAESRESSREPAGSRQSRPSLSKAESQASRQAERASQRKPAQASCKRDAGAGVRVVCPCVKRFFAKREADVDGSA